MLEQLGVTPVADSIYVRALETAGQAPSRLGASLGFSADEWEKGWAELVELGVATIEADGSAFVVPPPAVYDILLLRLEENHFATTQYFERARRFVQFLAIPDKDRSIIALGEGVKGESLVARLDELAHQTSLSVLTFAPGGAATPERMQESRARNAELFARGVQSRTIYLTTALKDRATAAHLEWLVENGAEVRTTPTLPMRMVIIDEKVAVVPASPTDGMLGAIIVRNPSLVGMLQSVFERTWATSTPFGSAQSAKTKSELLDEERAILELIALGQTDEQIAVATGLTKRMVRRVGDEMKAKLGAASRAAIGYLAVKKGWL